MNTYKRHRYPPDIISYAVSLYYRFNLSHRDVEDLRAERGITVNRDTVMSYGGEILPMVEVIDFGSLDPEGLQTQTHARDLIAGDCSSSKFIVGILEDFGGDTNNLKISLHRDNELLFTGQGSDTLGNQMDSLVFLINQALTLDYALLPGHYLMTGSLGRMYLAEPGKCTANYGEFGGANFSSE